MTTTTARTLPANTWTDSQGRRWSVTIRIGHARQLKAAGLDILDPPTLDTILRDELAQLNLLRHLVEPQAAAHGLADPAAFEEAMTAGPDDFPQALAALLGELSGFFRRLARHKPANILADAAAKIAAGQTVPDAAENGPASPENASPPPTPGPDSGTPPAALP